MRIAHPCVHACLIGGISEKIATRVNPSERRDVFADRLGFNALEPEWRWSGKDPAVSRGSVPGGEPEPPWFRPRVLAHFIRKFTWPSDYFPFRWQAEGGGWDGGALTKSPYMFLAISKTPSNAGDAAEIGQPGEPAESQPTSKRRPVDADKCFSKRDTE